MLGNPDNVPKLAPCCETETCLNCGGEFDAEQPRSLVANTEFFCADCTDELLEMDESQCECDGGADSPYCCPMHQVKFELMPEQHGIPFVAGSRR